MKIFGLTLSLQDEPNKIATYKIFHQSVWPEVTERLRVCGVQQMQIFPKGTRMFMYLVTDDSFDPPLRTNAIDQMEALMGKLRTALRAESGRRCRERTLHWISAMQPAGALRLSWIEERRT